MCACSSFLCDRCVGKTQHLVSKQGRRFEASFALGCSLLAPRAGPYSRAWSSDEEDFERSSVNGATRRNTTCCCRQGGGRRSLMEVVVSVCAAGKSRQDHRPREIDESRSCASQQRSVVIVYVSHRRIQVLMCVTTS